MMTLDRNPSAAYRKIELDARIEASSGSNLAAICLEEILTALSAARNAVEHGNMSVARGALTRSHGIILGLAHGVDQSNSLAAQLVNFYGGLAALIRRNIAMPQLADIDQASADFADLLAAMSAA